MRRGSATISPTRLDRVERGVRVLEDVLHLPAHACASRSRQSPLIVCAVEGDAPAGHRHEAHDGAAGRGLAAAGFADEAQRLARAHGEADAVDRPHPSRSCAAGGRRGSGKCTCRLSTASSGVAPAASARRHRAARDDARPRRRGADLLGEVAGGLVCRADGPQRRVLLRAAGRPLADGAARMEGAARRQARRRRRLARDRIEPRLGALRYAGCSAAAPPYRDGAAAGRSPRPARSRRCGRHTSPRRDGRLRRRRRDRA